MLDLNSILHSFEHQDPYRKIGKITRSRGMIYDVCLPKAAIGSHVEIITTMGDSCLGEVVGIENSRCKIIPYQELPGINSDTRVYLKEQTCTLKIGGGFLGRVIDHSGHPLDEEGEIIHSHVESRNIYGLPMNPLNRPMISEAIDIGIHSINGFMTVGRGQRLAILSGSGVGKSVILGMIAEHSDADINVVALIGERGREVLEFIKNDLGTNGLKKSIIIVATSDMSSLIRVKCAYVATTIAEYFRDQGKNVMFLMDSITRFAMAHREISLSLGEPPAQKGYTPSVFAKLPKLMERAGTKKNAGSITGIYTVLVEGDDIDEPIADAVRAIADGHIVLSRELAEKNHFPAIDILASISRVMKMVVSKEHRVVSSYLRNLLAIYKENEDLINIGAYSQGTNKEVDKAIEIMDDFMLLMKQEQDMNITLSPEVLFDRMIQLARKAELYSEKESS